MPNPLPKRVLFSQNWNKKLDCTVFTTIRKKDFPVDALDACEIILNGKKLKDAQCVHTEVMPFRDLNWATLAMDTGYLTGAIKIFQNFGINTDVDDVKVLIFKTT